MPDEPTPHESLRTLSLRTEDGIELEAQLRVPADIRGVAVVAHPHPLYGGDLQNAVVEILFRALPQLGVATLRFNFRGVGRSTGSHHRGNAERIDYVAALDAVAKLDERAPLFACGYSFGADVALACDHERLARWLVVAPPLSVYAPNDIVAGRDERIAHLIVAAHDQYSPPDVVRAKTAAWRNTTIDVVDGADHFFGGALQPLGQIILNLGSSLDLN